MIDTFGYYEYTETTVKRSPCFWKNGQIIDLHNPSSGSAFANAIAVENGTAYVAGYFVVGGFYKACYWQVGAAETATTFANIQ